MPKKRTKPVRAQPFSASTGAGVLERALCRAGFAARAAAAAALATALASVALCPATAAFAQEDVSASVGVTLSPIESIGQEEAGTPEAKAGSDDAPAPEKASEAAALPRTGDQTALAVGILLFAAAAAGATLWIGRAGRPVGKVTRRDRTGQLLGIVLASSLAAGTMPATMAQAAETSDGLPQESSQPASRGNNDAPEKSSSEGQNNLGEAGEAKAQTSYADDGESVPESNRAQGAASAQSPFPKAFAPLAAKAPSLASASPLATQRPYDDWGSYSYRIIGDPVIGTRISIQFTPGPDLDSSVRPAFTWYYAPFYGTPYTKNIGTGSSIVVPEEARGMNLHVRIDDAAEKVGQSIFFAIGAVGDALPGSASIEGSLIAGSVLSANLSGLPADCDPKIIWYSGSKPNETDTYLNQGTSLHLENSMVGKYITIRVEDRALHYAGHLAATIGPVQKERPNAPDILETRVFPDGTLSVLCQANGTLEHPTSAVSLESKGKDGQWREVDRKTPANAHATCEIDFSADLSEELENSGSVQMRAVSYNPAGASAASAERTVSAQIGVTVPLSLECQVAGDGSVNSETQQVQNTGTLNAAIDRIETAFAPGVESHGDWTCSSGETTLFQGAFGSSASVAERLVIAPGESLPIAWSARKITFSTTEPSGMPLAYGTVTYVVSPALG